MLESCPELNRADAHVPRTNSLETIRNMVASGLGISVLPRDALTPKYHSRMVVPVPFAKPGADAPRRACVPAQLSAAGGDRGDPRGGRCVPAREGDADQDGASLVVEY